MRSNVMHPINLGSPFEVTILELAKTVNDLINPNLKIEFLTLPVDDLKQRRPDTKISAEKLGWSAKFDLKMGLSKMTDFISHLEFY